MSTMRDLQLSYETAVHGIQTAIAYDIERGRKATEPKHMRTGVDTCKAEMRGLAELLISKGVITVPEYCEFMRLAVNEEVAMREAEVKRNTGIDIQFR